MNWCGCLRGGWASNPDRPTFFQLYCVDQGWFAGWTPAGRFAVMTRSKMNQPLRRVMSGHKHPQLIETSETTADATKSLSALVGASSLVACLDITIKSDRLLSNLVVSDYRAFTKRGADSQTGDATGTEENANGSTSCKLKVNAALIDAGLRPVFFQSTPTEQPVAECRAMKERTLCSTDVTRSCEVGN